ncbi:MULTISPECIES: phage baseplate assembly protein V [Marinomonas]|uniref:Phage baseplate assembly protein V n=1 Tax=Marinomonas rhodophyticola TaxID=2992803 RepID=A0ABT3KCN0_9GAMM|nr:phage baseplate assembly protein V [Marinomonas sp. KJ51-3]MCW4628289.1 phage baseplate assembly protein V [Marinomonas sp. KJ51-3]
MNRLIDKALAPLRRRISQMLVRALVTSVNEGVKRQTLQVKMRADESADDIERFQNYGTSSNPPLGSEAILAALGGNLGQLVAIAVENKQYRPKGEMGDVFLYHMEGHRVQLTKDGVINITANKVNLTASESVTIVSPETTIISPKTKIEGELHVTENIKTDANIVATGSVTATGAISSSAVVSGSDLTAGGISYLGHKHLYDTDQLTQGPQ